MIKRQQLEGIALAKANNVYQAGRNSVTSALVEESRSMMEMGVPLLVATRKVGIS